MNDKAPTLEAALAALQRVEEVLDAHAESEWARFPQTQEIRDAIADIETQAGGWEPLIG